MKVDHFPGTPKLSYVRLPSSPPWQRHKLNLLHHLTNRCSKKNRVIPRQFPASLMSLDLGELVYPNLDELCGLPRSFFSELL